MTDDELVGVISQRLRWRVKHYFSIPIIFYGDSSRYREQSCNNIIHKRAPSTILLNRFKHQIFSRKSTVVYKIVTDSP